MPNRFAELAVFGLGEGRQAPPGVTGKRGDGRSKASLKPEARAIPVVLAYIDHHLPDRRPPIETSLQTVATYHRFDFLGGMYKLAERIATQTATKILKGDTV